MKPKISVVITTYNRPELVKRAIESVKRQTFKEFEIIVVDDASKEDYSEISSLDGVRYIRMEENGGTQAKPKNAGIMKAEGQFITFLDDDNEFRPDHLLVLYNEIKKGEADVIYGDRVIVDKDGKTQGVGVSSEFNPALLMEQNFIDTSDFIIRKSVLEAIGGWDERYKRMLDWNLVVRLHKQGYTFKRVPVIITTYYLHKDSLSFKIPEVKWNPQDVEIELPYLGHRPIEPRVAVYSLTYNRLDYTRECFNSLYETAGYEFDHYIWDNGSTDGTHEYLDELEPSGYCKNIEVIRCEDNKGISIASNGLVQRIQSKDQYDILVKSDNDALYKTEGWLSKMVDIWKSNKKVVLSCYIEGLRDNPGGASRLAYGEVKDEILGVTKHVGGICHFVDIKGYDGFKWDEDSALHGVQDVELSQHLLKNGYLMGYLENYYCEHKDGTQGQEKKYGEYFKKRKEVEKVKSYKEAKDEGLV